VIDELRAAADALERSAAHCRVAAEHHEQGDTPRMAAHVLAARGDMLHATGHLDEVARTHAGRAQLAPPAARG
jgi:hypothetical protein